MKNKARFLIVASLLVAGLLFSAKGASAANNFKPGWGFGDNNHIHIGPPGLSVRPQPPRPFHLPHWFFQWFHQFFNWNNAD